LNKARPDIGLEVKSVKDGQVGTIQLIDANDETMVWIKLPDGSLIGRSLNGVVATEGLDTNPL
jgi:hypothetical protein